VNRDSGTASANGGWLQRLVRPRLNEQNMKTRIVKIEHPHLKTRYEIQQKHHLFWWWWCPAWLNSNDPYDTCSYDTMEEAVANQWRYEGIKSKETVAA
jgi:hypothetical protein